MQSVIQRLTQNRSINAMDVAVFLRQLAVLLAGGVVITQACEILEKSQSKIAMRLLIYHIKREVLTGKTLFHSLYAYPKYFDDFICQLVKIGDETGKLEIILANIADYKEKQLALHKRLKQACFYPGIMLVAACFIVILMLLFVVPKFKTLFQNISGELPLLSAWIFWLSDTIEYVIMILGVLVVITCLCFRGRIKQKIVFSAKRLFYQLPLIKTTIQKIIWARFAKQLALTLAAGIPITNALSLTANACDHHGFVSDIKNLHANVSQGQQLHHAMKTLACFPPLMIQMVKVGEASGKLDEMLAKVAHFLEAEIDHLTNYLTQLLEPLIMLILGVLIGGLVIGMYLPIFKLNSGL